ncbi:hypothetical protein IBTHAUMO2_610003 [Nitrosopumilaceae archaeon]|nr:hypothetical protein IBTHAUMO2_610003 [Nitrosopumilaceae archaeon]
MSLFRPIATTRLYKKGKRNPVLKTVIPKQVLELIGAAPGEYIRWAIGDPVTWRPGKKTGYRPMSCEKDRPGAVRIQPTGTAIPMDVAEEIGLEDGGTADWLLAARPGGVWEVHIRARDVEYDDERPRQSGPGEISRKLLSTTRIRRYRINGGTTTYNARFPSICHRILCLSDKQHVKWDSHTRYYSIVPCHPADDGARKISRQGNGPKGPSSAGSYTIRLPGMVSTHLYAGEDSHIKWYVAADGYGRWAIQAWPSRSWGGRPAPDSVGNS